MIFTKTKIEGVCVIEPELKGDERGFFVRTFCKNELAKVGLGFDIVQANVSFNKEKGTLRGMHFQTEPHAEDKIVQCIKGTVYDVAVDLREDSKTYGQWVGQELSQENRKMMLIPKGCAHGFLTLVDNCELQYFMSEYYYAEHASGVRFDDPLFNIVWPANPVIISEKDKNWPLH